MRKLLSIAIVVLAVGGVFAASPGAALFRPQPPQTPPDEEPAGEKSEPEKKLIDLKADLMGPVAPGDSAIFLVGDFAAQHNGAVITADSAVRYSADRIEFFGHVLINQNTTYVYGDRAEYDGSINEARVYSDIVKVVDGDATLYTYNFVFNTKDNVGTFTGGGVMYNRDNLMEALRGYYFSNTKELVCVDSVQMRNDEYRMKGDSVIYDLDTDHAFFFARTNIWNRDGDYIYTDRGSYSKADSLYSLTLNGYILTAKQEVWSDSLDYWRGEEHAVLRRNIQIDDSERKTLAFGDYGEYWKEPGNALLTLRPSLVNYDPQQPDSLFARADTIWLYTIFPQRDASAAVARPDSLAAGAVPRDSLAAAGMPQDVPASAARADSTGRRRSAGPNAAPGGTAADSMRAAALRRDSLARSAADTAAFAAGAADSLLRDSLSRDSTLRDTLPEPTPAERKAKLREAAAKAKAERKAEAARLRAARLDTIAMRRQAKATAKLLAQKEREEARLAARREKALVRLHRRQQKAILRGRELPDSSMLVRLDSLIDRNAAMRDSLALVLADSLAADFLADSAGLVSIEGTADTLAAADTMYRLVKAYRNVKIFRTDFQSVCDSLTADSRDSTIHLYIDPVLWNEANQITSEVMDIYTENRRIVRAEFVGEPMMVGEIDTAHYNQVAGKEMVAYFRNNKIYRNDVNGNAQTIYYMQESGSPEVVSMLVVESGNIRFYITEENKIRQITYVNDPNYVIYPMDKIPPEQEFFLPDFKWEAARRPTRGEVFDRRLRPSERAMRERLPQPRFPIAAQLGKDRLRFAAERGWIDRNDVVTPEIEEWMRSLGYATGQPRAR